MAPAFDSESPETIASLCRSIVHDTADIGVEGVGLTQWVSADSSTLLYASTSLTRRLHELELTLGEGPALMARQARAPVLISDLSSDPLASHWVTFAREAGQARVRSIFVFPLQIGAVMLGSLTLHSGTTITLTELIIAQVLGRVDALALALLVPGATGDSRIANHLSLANGGQAATHQASGMVSVQLGGTLGEAIVTLRAYAFSHDLALAHVARAVVDRTLRFTRDADPEGGVRPVRRIEHDDLGYDSDGREGPDEQ